NEDAEMPDAMMQRVDDGLTVGDDLLDVVIQVEDPAQRLLGRRYVVPPRAEADDRRPDVAQVDAYALGSADLSGRELVSDEQIVGDPLHFAGVEQDRACPTRSRSRGIVPFRCRPWNRRCRASS